MDNVFAYLGILGGIDTLTNKNGVLNKLWEGMDIQELPFHKKENVTAEEIAVTTVDIFSKNFSYILNNPKEDHIPSLDKSGNIFPNFPKNEDEIREFNSRNYLMKKKNEFVNYVLPPLKEELKFIMISSWEYTQSLYKLKIRNVNGDNKPDYISAFDREQRNVQRMIQHSSQKFKEINPNVAQSFYTIDPLREISESVLPALPQFIKRLYDGKTLERNVLMHSIYDIGPVLGLIGSATPKKNPYLIHPEINITYYSSVSKSTNSLNTNKPDTATSIYSFLSAFSCVPLKSSGYKFSADKVITRCISETEKEPSNNRKLTSSDFLETLTPAKLTVLCQYLTERFVNGCLLSKAYLCKNESPAQKYINKYIKRPCQDEFEDYFDFYINKIVNKLTLLPLVRTRLYVIDYLQSYIKNISELNPKPRPFGEPERTPALIYHYLEELTSYIRENIKYWTEVVIPWHILCFHYLVTSFELNINSNGFFESIYNTYQFYDYNEQGKIDINQSSDIFTNMHLKQICALEKESKDAFNISSKKYYQYFMHETIRTISTYNFSTQLAKNLPGKNLSSFKNTKELKQALLFDGFITVDGSPIITPED